MHCPLSLKLSTQSKRQDQVTKHLEGKTENKKTTSDSDPVVIKCRFLNNRQQIFKILGDKIENSPENHNM
jgi:hypothetical protein